MAAQVLFQSKAQYTDTLYVHCYLLKLLVQFLQSLRFTKLLIIAHYNFCLIFALCVSFISL